MVQRERNYDLLRCISAILVVILHASAFYVQSDMRHYAMIGTFLQGVARTAVPCFVMLSGAFLLGDERWKHYSFALNKTIKVILAPTLGYSIIFIAISFSTYYLGVSQASYGEVIVNALKGYPYPHMWYMFVCFGLYFSTPLIWYLKTEFRELGQKWYVGLVVLLVVLGSIVQGTSQLIWIVRFTTFIGYFMLGDLIRYHYANMKKNISWIALLVWICSIFASCYIQIWIPGLQLWGGLHTDPLNPLVIVASVGCFVFFSSLNVRWDTFSFAKHTSRVYLVHMVPLQVLKVVMERGLGGLLHPMVGIPLMVLFSLGCSIVYSIITNRVKHKLKMEWL